MKDMFITANQNKILGHSDYASSLRTVYKVNGRKV